MDCDELFEGVIEDEDVKDSNYMNSDDVSDEDTGVDIKYDENSEENKPVRDDSAYTFSVHKSLDCDNAVLNFEYAAVATQIDR